MAFLSRQDLKFDYQWSAIPPDDARVTGAPDNLLLNRREGQEVLAFLNKTSASEDGALKAERLIRNHLPGEVRGRKNGLVASRTGRCTSKSEGPAVTRARSARPCRAAVAAI
jgi:hypothetical protein